MPKKEVQVARELTPEEKWTRGACSGDQAAMDTLLKSNPDLINKQDQLGVTALVNEISAYIYNFYV